MACLSKENVKKLLDKVDYRTCDKPTQATATWWSNFRCIQYQNDNFLPYEQCRVLPLYPRVGLGHDHHRVG